MEEDVVSNNINSDNHAGMLSCNSNNKGGDDNNDNNDETDWKLIQFFLVSQAVCIHLKIYLLLLF